MATVPTTRWDDLLSSRAQIGWTGPATARRRGASLTESLYEFGGGLPDPASFPHDGMLDATARMLKAEGDDAMTYGEAQGYLGLRELICRKYEIFEGLVDQPGEHPRLERLGERALAGVQRLRGHRRRRHHRGADLLGHAQHDPPPRRRDPRRAGRRRGHRHGGRARGAGDAAGRRGGAAS